MSQSEELLSVGNCNGEVTFYDHKTTSNKTILSILEAHKSSIRSCLFNKNSTQLVTTSSDDGFVKMWDIRATKEPIRALICHNDGVTSFSFGESDTLKN
eukprot:TRINITY_DN8775_c0_g1_i1.p1 TRINITY_DN8775_c0_g1~~TRINITY_DN8775_c0_g1_i1.p1  ORF type:complete len:108 (+),score=8.02 TRINITY_DN8775_c0_g1_i1:30-326(+)